MTSEVLRHIKQQSLFTNSLIGHGEETSVSLTLKIPILNTFLSAAPLVD
ncbi:hypothetical protein I4641_12700 [Waterburya agarophytonicola K14]|uniref:Uncharacterized protein n=1 Tax=Waterburya agarophytonicola KI4 TaxID=2874699 RepID=A0A964FGC3_9CYAN|nr:hypothetical protein [Waterburya agarophytonicola]MCC0177836.1 hypothetical protein [Waterburya agarophytonicola KI4]